MKNGWEEKRMLELCETLKRNVLESSEKGIELHEQKNGKRMLCETKWKKTPSWIGRMHIIK